MKKVITLLCCIMYSYGSCIWASGSFTISVPQELLRQKASLVIYMLDPNGNQCIGKCELDNNCLDHKISQDALKLTTCEEANRFDTVIDLMSSQVSGQDIVMLHFEFDSAVRILRILIVKDSLLEEDPFNVLTLSLDKPFEKLHHTFEEFEENEELDELSALVSNVDDEAMDQSIRIQERKTSRLEKYMLFAEIYMLMQYGRMKRAMHGFSSWFSNSK